VVVGEQVLEVDADRRTHRSADLGVGESPSLVLVINDTKLLMPCV